MGNRWRHTRGWGELSNQGSRWAVDDDLGHIQGSILEASQRNSIPLPILNAVLPRKWRPYKGLPFPIKRTTLIGWKFLFLKMAASIGGLSFAIKRAIVIGWTIGHFRGAFFFLSSLKLEMPQRHVRGSPWMEIGIKNCCGVDSESTLRQTLNAALVVESRWVLTSTGTDGGFWLIIIV